jgi:hypothetical protein
MTISTTSKSFYQTKQQRASRRQSTVAAKRTTYLKTDQLWLQRLKDDNGNKSSSILWIDLENVRGKTGFDWSHEHVLDLTARWSRYHNTVNVVVVADHGSRSQAVWDTQRDLAVVFSGDVFPKADDVLARHVGLDFLLMERRNTTNPASTSGLDIGGGHSVIVTADNELQTRCRRACKHSSYHIVDPTKFVEELEAMAELISEEEEEEEENSASSQEFEESGDDGNDNSLQEQLQMGQLDEEIRLRAQILDVQVLLGRGKNVRKKNVTNKRRKKLQSRLDNLQHQLVRRGPSLLDQVTSLDNQDVGFFGGDDSDSSSTILKSHERELILKRWNEIQHRSRRKEQTGDRVVLAEQLRRQLSDSSSDEELDDASPAKVFVQYFNQQYYDGAQSKSPLPQSTIVKATSSSPSSAVTSSSSIEKGPSTMELLGDPSQNPLLGLEQLQIVAISDTHGFEGQLLTDTQEGSAADSGGFTDILPHGDLLLHLGDFSAEGSSEMEQKGWKALDEWLAKQPHPIKIVVRGNHDPWNYDFEQSGAWYITEPTTLSLNDNLSLGVVPYGSSRKLTASNSIPTDCDIFASHVPPLKTLDRTFTGKSAGSGFLNRVVTSMGKNVPRLWLCGHIHEGRGVAERQFGGKKTTTVINAANANRGRATHLDHGAVVVQIHADPSQPVQVLEMEDQTIAKKVASSDKFFQAKLKEDTSDRNSEEKLVLAVDLGLKSGVALFGSQGRLLRYEQFHFEKDSLHDTAKRLLTEWEQDAFQYGSQGENEQGQKRARVTHIAIEGADGYMLRAWADAATGLSILRVTPEEWRAELLLEKERSSGSNAKAASRLVARQVVEDFGVMPRHEGKFHTDVAEAVCLGLYVSSRLGWVDRGGAPTVRRYTNGNIIVPK